MKYLQTALLALAFSVSALFAPAALAQERPAHAAPYAPPDRELMVPVEGGRVYVRVNGTIGEGAVPVIFIHGGPGGTHNGFTAMLGLADERPVILYDQLDSGRSDRPNDPANWRVDRFVSELEAIRRALGVTRWHIVGHSWGSAVALEYSVRYPEHVASTVLAGTYISTSRWIDDANILLTLLPEPVQVTIAACEGDAPPPAADCDAAVDVFYAHFNRREPAAPELTAYYRSVGGQGFNPTIYNAMWGPSEFRSTGSLKDYDAVALLDRIDGARTMFMVGQYDEARIDTAQDFAARTPGSELAVVPGAAHGMITDRPIATAAILRGWFRRHDAE